MLLLENVPGLLSIDEGATMATIVSELEVRVRVWVRVRGLWPYLYQNRRLPDTIRYTFLTILLAVTLTITLLRGCRLSCAVQSDQFESPGAPAQKEATPTIHIFKMLYLLKMILILTPGFTLFVSFESTGKHQSSLNGQKFLI